MRKGWGRGRRRRRRRRRHCSSLGLPCSFQLPTDGHTPSYRCVDAFKNTFFKSCNHKLFNKQGIQVLPMKLKTRPVATKSNHWFVMKKMGSNTHMHFFTSFSYWHPCILWCSLLIGTGRKRLDHSMHDKPMTLLISFIAGSSRKSFCCI